MISGINQRDACHVWSGPLIGIGHSRHQIMHAIAAIKFQIRQKIGALKTFRLTTGGLSRQAQCGQMRVQIWHFQIGFQGGLIFGAAILRWIKSGKSQESHILWRSCNGSLLPLAGIFRCCPL